METDIKDIKFFFFETYRIYILNDKNSSDDSYPLPPQNTQFSVVPVLLLNCYLILVVIPLKVWRRSCLKRREPQ